MKYIIKESQISKLIWEYLNENFSNMNSFYHVDDYGNEDDCAEVFYKGDFKDDSDYELRVYRECFWDEDNLTQRNLSPILEVGDVFFDRLNAYFGEIWIPIMKEWFKANYGEDIKTIK